MSSPGKSFSPASASSGLLTTTARLRDTPTPTTDHQPPLADTSAKSKNITLRIRLRKPTQKSLTLPSPPFAASHPQDEKQPNSVAHHSARPPAPPNPSPSPKDQVFKKEKRDYDLAEGVTDAEPYTQHMRPRSEAPTAQSHHRQGRVYGRELRVPTTPTTPTTPRDGNGGGVEGRGRGKAGLTKSRLVSSLSNGEVVIKVT